MRKWNMMLLALALVCMPAAGFAQELPDLFTAVYEGIGEGLAQAAEPIGMQMQEELTLALSTEDGRIEEGKTMQVTVAAGNPLTKEAAVSFHMMIPDRLSAAPDAAWQAVLPPAEVDPKTGEMKPSVTVFTREITLLPGGGSETAALSVEMSMGTRFYRAQQEVQLCVPDVTVEARLEGTQDGRVLPGGLVVYQIDVRNSGTAPQDIELELTLPEDTAAEQMPAGFALSGRTLRGTVRAEAAAQEEEFHQAIRVPVRIDEDALDGDADAIRLMSGVLRVNGEGVALPRMQVCGAKISARLTADKLNLEAGEETMLRVVLANSGLAEADVQVSCVLPEGLALTQEKRNGEMREDEKGQEATPGEAVLPMGGGEETPAMAEGVSALSFDVHMDAAQQTEDGVTAYTTVIDIPVTAREPQKKLNEQLLGAALSWQVDDDPPQLAQAVAMRVYHPTFLGIAKEDWSGVFWASLLLLNPIAGLCAAVKGERSRVEFCYE